MIDRYFGSGDTDTNARVAPAEEGERAEGAQGAEDAEGDASAPDVVKDEEEAEILRLRTRFCQDTLISNQMAEGASEPPFAFYRPRPQPHPSSNLHAHNR